LFGQLIDFPRDKNLSSQIHVELYLPLRIIRMAQIVLLKNL